MLSLHTEFDSDKSFERRIHTLAASGVNVGTKNHSFALVGKLRSSMHTVLVAGIQKMLLTVDPATGRTPVFATMIDKATVDRETGQMAGIIVFLQGQLTAIFLSTLLAPDATGDGLADLLISALMGGYPLKLTIELLRQSWTAFAADGQYQSEVEGHASGLAVQQHLCSKLSLLHSFLLSRWDGAHRLELGQDSVRAENAFYKDMAATVSSAQEKHLYGKGFDRVKKDAAALKTKVASIGTVCTTRFCHSERKVYKNFLRNLPLFVRDLKAQATAAGLGALSTELEKKRKKLSSVTFVVHLMGIIDLLRHLKDLSLLFQTVNQLPWELEEFSAAFLLRMGECAQDLDNAKVDRMVAPLSGDQQIPAFELLKRNMADLKRLKLVIYDKDDSVLGDIDLVKASDLRSSRSTAAAAAAATVEDEIKLALKDLANMAKSMVKLQTVRLATPAREKSIYEKMARCLDFRKMACLADYIPTDARVNASKHAVQTLVEWLASRFNGVPATDRMPNHGVVFTQFVMLTSRLQVAFTELPFSVRWKGASGTVIMKDVFTMERFYKDCHDYLYLFSHCGSKSMCEAVIEGCGSIWDKGARHHPSFTVGTERGVIAWNAPRPWHPEAKVFVNHALAHLFKGDVHGHFNHINKQTSRIPAFASSGGSVVMQRQKRVPNRLPSNMYDTSVLS